MKTNPLFLTRHLDGATFRYKPQHGIDGGFLSEWEPLYEASTVKADADKLKAFQSGVPVGSKYEPTGTKSWAPVFENAERKLLNKHKYKGGEELDMLVVSDLHRHEEYGGPFWIKVPSTARVREVRLVISEKCGILPGLQRMSYAGKQMEDAERKLEHYGVKYWNKKFPDWPLYIRRY